MTDADLADRLLACVATWRALAADAERLYEPEPSERALTLDACADDIDALVLKWRRAHD